MIFWFYLGAEIFLIPGHLVLRALFKKEKSLVIAKFVGIALVSMLGWILAVLSQQSAVLMFGISFIIISLAGLSASLLQKRKIFPSTKELKFYIALTLFSFGLYMILNYFRTFRTDINGTEKFMDVALMNTILKQDKLPIENPWLSGFFMNYYYVGQYIIAMLSSYARVPINIGYNFGIALVGVWIFQTSWVFLYMNTKKIFWSYLFAFTATFGGNYYMLYEWFILMKKTTWFASATRVIPFTINEFPSYSVVLGDLHGHYLSMPFFILTIILLFELWKALYRSFKDLKTVGEKIDILIIKNNAKLFKLGALTGVLLGFLYYINSWDDITLGILLIIIGCFYVSIILVRKRKQILVGLVTLILTYASIGVPGALLFAFSRLSFFPAVSGIGINKVFSNPLWYLALFGQFITIVVIGIVLLIVFRKSVLTKFLSNIKVQRLLLLTCLGVFIVFIVEFVYLKDVFSVLNPPYSRTNTVFKFYYHAWELFSLGIFGAITILLSNIEKLKHIGRVKFAIILTPVLIVCAIMVSYFFVSVSQFLNPQFVGASVKRFYDPTYMNGYAYVEKSYKDDAEILKFLEQKPYSVIAEYIDYESYSYGARFSAYSGDTSVEGWPLHNVQWYGGYDGKGLKISDHKLETVDVAKRVTDIAELYKTNSRESVSAILKKYGVEYLIIGTRELDFMQKEHKQNIYEPYNTLCNIVWSKDEYRIYQCK